MPKSMSTPPAYLIAEPVAPPGYAKDTPEDTMPAPEYTSPLTPTQLPVASVPLTLPPNWQTARHEEPNPVNGVPIVRVYFYNTVTGQTSWEHPQPGGAGATPA